MKNAILGLALVGLALGCRSDKNASVSDPSAANMPKAECCAGKSECSDAAKASCEGKKSACTAGEAKPQN